MSYSVDACIAVYNLPKLRDGSRLEPVQTLSYARPGGGPPAFVWTSNFSGNGQVFVAGSWNGKATCDSSWGEGARTVLCGGLAQSRTASRTARHHQAHRRDLAM